MYKFLPFMTNDGSVGLFSEGVDDIYHSAFGALSEAYEKFVNNILFKFNDKTNLNVLDICYGVGYNSKAFINEALKNNISCEIDCVDNDEILIQISPFIKSKINFWDQIFNRKNLYKNISDYNEAKKIITLKNKFSKLSKYKIQQNVNFIIIKNLIKNYGNDFLSDTGKKILALKTNLPFFDKNLVRFYEFYSKNWVYLHLNRKISSSVHNIYYRNVSKRYLSCLDNNINMHFYSKDIREYLLNCNTTYDIVFLDGFTPSKCPVIWSIEFFEILYKHLDNDGVIVTYNKSAPVRNAALQSGFYIGNILDEKLNAVGTIISKNESYIKNKLSIKDLGLLNTKAGIPYRDTYLNSNSDDIIKRRKDEIANSNLISSSKYMKLQKELYET